MSDAFADWVAINELTATYNRAADDGDPALLASVFVEDASVTFDGPKGVRTITGRDEIAKIADRPGGQTVHATTNAVIEIDGDSATQVCTLLLTRREPEPGTGTGRYTDSLVRTADGWRFASRRAKLD